MYKMPQVKDKIGLLTLRKKQKEFIEAILTNGEGTYLLNVPGGYGKTDAVLAAYKLLKERGDVNRFLYLCWGATRKKEFEDDLEKKLNRIEFKKSTKYLTVDAEGAITIKESRENLYEFYLLNAELLVSRAGILTELTKSCRWFVVVDESHHATEENEGGKAINGLEFKYRVGLSATPANLSAQSLINISNTDKKNAVVMNLAEAIEEQAIRPFRYDVANYDVELLDGRNELIKLTTDEIREWEGNADKIEGEKYDVQKKLRMSDRYVHQIFTKAMEYYNSWNLEFPDQHRILVFAPNVMSAKYACEIINSCEGKGFADWIGTGFYGRPTEENQQIKRSFVSGDLKCLVQVSMAGEGFDAPKASIGIWLSFAYNGNMAVQMCYRIMRRNRNIKEYKNDTCIMLVPSDSSAIELFEKIRETQSIEFEERKDYDKTDDTTWPDAEELIMQIVDAKIKEWWGEYLGEEKKEEIKAVYIDNKTFPAGYMNTPEFDEKLESGFETWVNKRNEKMKKELTKESYQNLLDRQIGTLSYHFVKAIYNGHPSIKGVIGDVKKKINAKIKKQFIQRDMATIEDLKQMCDWMTNEFNKYNNYKNVPSWL